jgi:hypothetical protein
MLALESTLGSLALEAAEIATAEEIKHTMLHCDCGFVDAAIESVTVQRYLCLRLKKMTETNN